nr:MAG TPA: YopX protein [Bacteriophage sp.]
MNDRYLFKAKRIDNGEWVIGNLITNVFFRLGQSIPYILCPDKAEYDCFEDFTEENGIFEVRPDTICRCTGLRDKNGTLIWENDIVKDLFSDVYAQIKYGRYHSCFDSTKTEHVGFYVDWSGKYTKRYRKDLGYWINMVNAEVIGNTFDNPQLLESED